MNYKNKLVLVTGASAGIGKEFACQFAELGASLLLIARREELLEELSKELSDKYQVDANYRVVDLACENSLGSFLLELENFEVDILVNNAGRGSFGYFEDLDIEEELSQIDLNIKATVKIAHAVIPKMKAKRSGDIISLSSIAGFQPLPLMATYAGTKAFNFYHSIALREELKEFNVNVLTVCPGPVATEFGGVARVPGTATSIVRDETYDVVKQSLKALKKKKPFVVPCLRSKCLSLPSRFLPKPFTSRRVYKMLSKVYSLSNKT